MYCYIYTMWRLLHFSICNTTFNMKTSIFCPFHYNKWFRRSFAKKVSASKTLKLYPFKESSDSYFISSRTSTYDAHTSFKISAKPIEHFMRCTYEKYDRWTERGGDSYITIYLNSTFYIDRQTKWLLKQHIVHG